VHVRQHLVIVQDDLPINDDHCCCTHVFGLPRTLIACLCDTGAEVQTTEYAVTDHLTTAFSRFGTDDLTEPHPFSRRQHVSAVADIPRTAAMASGGRRATTMSAMFSL
jgi:hypothetical protein